MKNTLSTSSASPRVSLPHALPWVAAALAEARDAHALAHLDGTLAYLNAPMLAAAGVTAAEARALDLCGLLTRFRTGLFDEPALAVRRVLQTGQPCERELTFPARGQTLALRIALVGRQEGEEHPLCLSVTAHDVTREKEYEKLKGDMLSLMSHELRTPVTSIGGFAELLLADESLAAEAREFLSIIHAESQRLARMINTFLSAAQLERQDQPGVVMSLVMLDDLVRETIAHFHAAARRKRIRLEGRGGRRVPPVAADRALITRAVAGLVDNAIKHSPERAIITLSTHLEADAVRLTVEDRGCGIPPADQPKVWERSSRAAHDGRTKEEFTGRGLPFVREVVERHGGTVSLESAPGRGSRFSFTLPRL